MDLSERLLHLSPEKREILLRRLNQVSPAVSPAKTGLERTGDRSILSFAQERLWFLDRIDPGNPAYNIAIALRLFGSLDADILEKSLETIVQRHEILRSTFVEVDGRPVQRIRQVVDFGLRRESPAFLQGVSLDQYLRKVLREEVGYRFDLTRDTLIRALLISEGDEVNTLMITVHHIVADGWSTDIIARELSTIYTALLESKQPELDPLSIQYPDYAAWEKQRFSGPELEGHLEYWRSRLGGSLPILKLPVDGRKRGTDKVMSGRSVRMFPDVLAKAVKEFCRKEGITSFVLLLAAFKVLLYRLTHQEDVIVGTPIAGRNREETQRLIGVFINTLALRTDLSGGPSFGELLRRVRETTLGAFEHQDIPFEKLLIELQPERNTEYRPVFQVFFNALNVDGYGFRLPGLDVEHVPVETESIFDLTLYVTENRDFIQTSFVYDAALFGRERIAEMEAQYLQILEQVLCWPERDISDLDLKTNTAKVVLPDPTIPLVPARLESIVKRFKHNVTRYPDRPAVIDRDGTLTYAELDRRSGIVSRRLIDVGVRKGQVVGVYAGRNAGLVISLIAIQKAGAAFLILDPAYPPARLAEYVGQAQPYVLIWSPRTPELPVELQRWPDERLITIDEQEWTGRERIDALTVDPVVNTEPEDVAYITFTSGSTGRPKGIVGSLGPLSHFCDWYSRTFSVTEDDRYSCFSGLAHDPLLRDLLVPLWTGGTICMPDPEDLMQPERLVEWMYRLRITVSHLTPAMTSLICTGFSGSATEESLAHLRYVFFGGELLYRGLIYRFAQWAPKTKWINFYGATETPQAMSWAVVDMDDNVPVSVRPDDRLPVPVGRGIDGCQLIVLDDRRRQCGIGEPGEVYIRSPYLSLGYLNDRDLTRASFLVNPFTESPGDQIYRTGDTGRYLPDGQVVLEGRCDDQLKIRGYRIEPGEIESLLSECPGVKNVVVRGKGEGENRVLAAYAVLDAALTSTHALQIHLKGRLPDYLVPSVWIQLDSIPLTPNGKVDVKALPETDALQVKIGGVNEPRSPIEEALVEIWTGLLGKKQVGIRDDFFALGGHSLLAIQVIARIRDLLGVDLPLRTLFESPTVEQLAQRVETARQNGIQRVVPPLEPVKVEQTEWPLSYSQQRLWLLQQMNPLGATYNMGSAVRVRGTLDLDVLESSLSDLVRRHESLRTRFEEREGVPVALVDASATIEMHRLVVDDRDEADRLARVQEILASFSRKPFDLQTGPLMRVIICRLAADDHVFYMVLHHIISDLWSQGIVSRELLTLYTSRLLGKPAGLIEKRIQYKDYALWQRAWLQGEVLKAQLRYWEKQLDGITPLEIPPDFPRPVRPGGLGSYAFYRLDPELLDRLDEKALAHNVTPSMALLACFNVLLYRYSGREDVAMGVPVANRRHSDVEEIVGSFINTLVIRTNLAGNPNLGELVRKVRDTMLEALDHQDVPFEKLVEVLHPDRRAIGAPFFNILFNVHNAPNTFRMPDQIAVESFPFDRGTTPFDIAITINSSSEQQVSVSFNTELYRPETIDRMIRHYEQVIRLFVAENTLRLNEISVLTDEEKDRILYEWNDTEVDNAVSECVHDLFVRQCRRTPDAIAIESGTTNLTYCELDRQSSRLAHFLRDLGLTDESPVGIFLERSIDAVVAMLAVSKAGGSYVPLDPAFPDARLSFMIESASIPIILTASSVRTMEFRGETRVIEIDRIDVPNNPAYDRTPCWTVSPDQRVYILFTSGSTGQPKGVEIKHASLVNFLHSMRLQPGMEKTDLILNVTTLAFDISALEIFLPLTCGARLVIPDKSTVYDGRLLAEALEAYNVTMLQATPATWRLLIDSGWKGKQGLTMLCGGEPLPPVLAGQLLERGGSLWNMYGPTETTVWSSAARIESPDDITIGRPIANTRIYILDRDLNPVPVGVVGTIFIAGAGVARGYLNRPDLTADRFVPDPFRKDRNEMMYDTGDQGRFRPDGRIVCLGRTDQQVKIRGFRIEPGEIEYLLEQYDGISQAAVIARPDATGLKQLVGFVTARESMGFDPQRVRNYLRSCLPEYMVPAYLVHVPTMPLTPNGKIDRNNLGTYDLNAIDPRDAYRAPETPTEMVLSEIWAALLGHNRISVRQSFFNLGGHSLLAMQLVSRIRDHFKLSIGLAVVFENPTIEELARWIDDAPVTHGDKIPLPPIIRRRR